MLGIFGGSFDPIHNGHLRLALDVLEMAALDAIHFVPTAEQPLKGESNASNALRVELLNAALADHDGFVLDERELARQGPSYTVDTLESIKADYPEQSICFMMGSDSLTTLHRWHGWQRLFELANIVVVSRPGQPGKYIPHVPEPEVATFIADREVDSVTRLHQADAGAIWRMNLCLLDISSTLIRNLCAKGRSIDYLVPPQVAAMLSAHKPYCY